MQSTITTHLHNHLTALRNLREGFIEQHGAEPSVSFRYSQQSTSNSTICLRVANNTSNGDNSQDNANVPSTSATENSNTETAEAMVNIQFYTRNNFIKHSCDVAMNSREKVFLSLVNSVF